MKAVAACARWALWALALFWVLLVMVWGGLHFLIVPRIAEFRPWVEQQASQVLGVEVRIGAIMALSNGLIPSIELRDVTLSDSAGREAMRWPSVLAAISPRSALGLGFEQLYVEGAIVDVRRASDGRLWVAGLPVALAGESDGRGADWVFDQAELVVRRGTVRWTDELRGVPMVELSGVNAVLRNRHRNHSLRLDITPPSQWGSPIQILGEFKQPLLSRHAGQWRQWTGQLYGNFPEIDLARLRRYIEMGVGVEKGVGALRTWVEFKKGAVTAVTADISLREARALVDPALEPLELRWAAGRLGARAMSGGGEFFTQALEFDTQDGLHWPGGNVKVRWFDPVEGRPARGELVADRLDLAAMTEIAERLPLPQSLRSAMANVSPRGLVPHLQMNWTGAMESVQGYAARGVVEGLTLAPWVRPEGTLPGVTGAHVEFDLTQAGGKLKARVDAGSLALVGILESPIVAMDHLEGDIQWKVDANNNSSVAASGVRFSTPDGNGDLSFKWQGALEPAGRTPGTLDLRLNLAQANAAKIYKYLPLHLDKSVRDYVQGGVVSGAVTSAKIKLKGPIAQFPFASIKQGEFSVAAALQDVVFAYAPTYLLPPGGPLWPSLTQLSGDLSIDQSVLRVKAAKAWVQGHPGLQISRADAEINNLYGDAMLSVTADARGPLGEVVNLVNESPLAGLTNHVLARATATGNVESRFKLAFPLAAIDRINVQGAITLAGNDIQVTPETPKMARARGTLSFSENGFGVSGGQVRALGGDARIEGGFGSVLPGARSPQQGLRLQGVATADGLRQAKELGPASRLAQYANGAANYTATLAWRAGVPELAVSSSLAGLALTLPAPFSKAADATLPLRLETTALPSSWLPDASGKVHEQDQVKLELGRLVNVLYVRDVSTPEPRVLRGSIALGLAPDEAAPLPDAGVFANINTPSLDIDAWTSVLTQLSGPDAAAGTVVSEPSALAAAAMGYAPATLALRAREISMGGRKLNHVLLGGAREGLVWRANLDATELNGHIEYRQPTGAIPGRLYSRLARVTIGPSAAREVETLLEEQPASIPALDIVVDDFDLRGKKLGRVEVDAVNLAAVSTLSRDAPREWRLNRFNITTPEAAFTATGNWTNIVALNEPVGPRPTRERRRTALKFKLDVRDAGALLERFGMPGVVRSGQGKLEGRIGWLGSPITFDYASLGGEMNVNIENGQFLKTDPGIGRLLGVLSLQSLPRRLALDFRDVFSDGFAFDFFRGDVVLEQGIARTSNLQMKGVTAAVAMEGQSDLAREVQTIKVVVVPEINAGSASLVASYINPVWGLSSFLAQLILRRPLIESLTQEFVIDGTWTDPRVTKVERK